MKPILEIRDLVVNRQNNFSLFVERLTVHEGEVLALIGPNGSGKTTFLLTLSHLIKPTGGSIEFQGRPLPKINELNYRRHLALVMQEPLLLDRSVFDNVAAGLRFRKLDRRRVEQSVDEWLERFNISHLKLRPAGMISGGEARRVSLARAFALQPDLLLLDEPFSALDAPTRAQLLEDLRSLLAISKTTTVFVTHILDEALILGHKVAVLLAGRLRQVGEPHEVFTAPSDSEVATFVGIETVIPGQVEAYKEGQVRVRVSEFSLEAVGDFAPGRSVLLCLRPEDITLWADEDPPTSSARNRLKGRILRQGPQGALVRVVVDCGFPLVALVTRASAREMELVEGKQVTATFKASAVHLIPR